MRSSPQREGALSLNNGGLVEYGNNTATGTGSSFILGTNSGLSVVNNVTLSAPITVNGTGNVISFNNGTASVIASNITLNNDVTFGLRDWYNYATARSGTVSGVISGGHAITINSGTATGAGGTLTLSGVNTYTGGTKVNAGSLVFNGTGSSASSDITLRIVNGGASVSALKLQPSVTSGTTTRAASLTVNGNNGTGNNFHNVLITPVAAGTNDQFTGALNLNSGGTFFGQLAASSGGNTVITFGSVTRNAGTVLNLISLAGVFGGAPGPTSTNLYFTTKPTLVGSGSAGTTSAGVLPWALVGGGIATYDAINGVRVLNNSTEQATLASGMTAGRQQQREHDVRRRAQQHGQRRRDHQGRQWDAYP